MKRWRHTLLVLVTIATCAGCDQVTKAVAKSTLSPGRVVTFAADTVRLQMTENAGAFLSLGASWPASIRQMIFTIGAGIVVGAIALYALADTRGGVARAVALALISGGGLSNLFDRVTYGGHVVDFLNIGVGTLRTGIFNVADMGVMAGVVLLLMSVRSGARNV